MEEINKLLTDKIVKLLEGGTEFSENQRQKISYSLCVLLGEIQKMLVLIIYFFWREKLIGFLLILLILALTKHYLGGIHLNSIIGCLSVTLILVNIIMECSNLVKFSSNQLIVIYIYSLIINILFAPTISKNHVITLDKKKIKKKIIVINTGLLIMGLYKNTLRGYIGWILLLVESEVLVIKVLQYIRKRGEKQWKKISERK